MYTGSFSAGEWQYTEMAYRKLVRAVNPMAQIE